MTAFNEQKRQAIRRNFSSVVEYLDRKFGKSPIHLIEVPSYSYKGNKSKLEITVYPSPTIAKVGVRIMGLKNYDREPAYECSYDLDSLSMTVFQRAIEDLISRMD